MKIWVPLVGSAAVAVAGGLVAVDYGYWSIKNGMLAEDDFWDRCRSKAMRGELEPGRYESVVWSERNETGVCEDVLGYCVVSKKDDGSTYGDALEEHQVKSLASDPANCTYLGQLLTELPPLRKVN